MTKRIWDQTLLRFTRGVQDKQLNLGLFLVHTISFPNLTPDIIHKGGRFSNAFPQKGLELVLSQKCRPVAFDPSLVLLPAEVDSLTKDRGCKKYAFEALSSNNIEMVFALLAEVIPLHLRVLMI